MKNKVLTHEYIESLKSTDRQYEVFDGRLPGFGVRVSPKGKKAFVLLYRINGRSRRWTIGHFGRRPTQISLADANKLALKALADIAVGKDPQGGIKGNQSDTESLLFSALALKYVEHHRYLKNRSWKETQRMLEQYFCPHWSGLSIDKITRSDVRKVLSHLVTNNGPSAANHGLAAIRAFFNWCISEDYLDKSPCYKLKKPAPEQPRDRSLQDYELKAVWASLQSISYPFGPFMKLLILTGQRRSEVAQMEWADLDFENKLWTIPASKNKSNRVHLVPLSDAAIGILQGVPKLSSKFVFPAKGNLANPISGFSKWKKRLDESSRIHEWRLHDLRRTMTTGLVKSGIPYLVADRLLNHKGQALSALQATYNTYDYLKEKREGVESWAAYVWKVVNENECKAASAIR